MLSVISLELCFATIIFEFKRVEKQSFKEIIDSIKKTISNNTSNKFF